MANGSLPVTVVLHRMLQQSFPEVGLLFEFCWVNNKEKEL